VLPRPILPPAYGYQNGILLNHETG
jgi:hypothetical protein